MPRNALTVAEVESMRTRLCAAALTIFRDFGMEAVTFRALADHVGVSHTLPYRYFENKDALLASVRVMCFEQFERFVRDRESTENSELGRVLAVLDAYVNFVFQHPVEYALIFATAQPPPQRYPELLAARRSLFEHSVELVQRCVDKGLVHGDARVITHAVWGSLHGLLTLHVANQLVHGCRIEELVRPAIFRILGLTSDQVDGAISTYARRPRKTGPLRILKAAAKGK
jgi:AcrR family transcriptional regulator